MSTATHTPGPWVHRPSNTRDSTTIWTADGVRCIAQMVRLNDAPVIAAAPELLAAAIKVLAELNRRLDYAAEHDQASPIFVGIGDLHAAIAKAQGHNIAG